MSENQITVVVKSTAGTWPDARFNENNKGQKVLDEAIRHFNLDPTPSVPYVLSHDGRALALSEKLADLGIESGAVLTVEAGQPIDA